MGAAVGIFVGMRNHARITAAMDNHPTFSFYQPLADNASNRLPN
jgi:hypothetical protein